MMSSHLRGIFHLDDCSVLLCNSQEIQGHFFSPSPSLSRKRIHFLSCCSCYEQWWCPPPPPQQSKLDTGKTQTRRWRFYDYYKCQGVFFQKVKTTPDQQACLMLWSTDLLSGLRYGRLCIGSLWKGGSGEYVWISLGFRLFSSYRVLTWGRHYKVNTQPI